MHRKVTKKENSLGECFELVLPIAEKRENLVIRLALRKDFPLEIAWDYDQIDFEHVTPRLDLFGVFVMSNL